MEATIAIQGFKPKLGRFRSDRDHRRVERSEYPRRPVKNSAAPRHARISRDEHVSFSALLFIQCCVMSRRATNPSPFHEMPMASYPTTLMLE